MQTKIFSDYKNRIPQELKDFAPFAPADDRTFWNNVSSDVKEEILKQAHLVMEKISTKGWPVLSASLWHDFYKNGNRINFENNYFNRRNLLTILVIAECIENKGLYLEAITDGIFMICEESGWQLPAHNSYIRDTPQLPYPDSSRPVFDLFAGETTNLLSLIYLMLKKQLDADSPMICNRIEKELEARIIVPYLNEHFWWMGNEDEPMCNWTPWCTQNALLTAFILPYSNEIRRKVIEQSLYSLDCFIKDYGEDGCCSEGAEYYRHAGLTFYNAMDIINRVSDGLIEDVYKLPQIKNIAEYIVNMNIPHSEYFFNFADCSPRAGKSGAREFLFGKAVGSEVLCSFASEHWKTSTVQEKLFSLAADKLSQSNLYYTLQSINADAEIKEYKTCSDKKDISERTIWYESNGVFIVHSGIYSTASKAGNNADSHNHNDTGSFIIYKNGEPFVIDVGVENYTQKTFSPQRYEIWTMQSSWHNLPELNGIMQQDGKQFAASETKIEGNAISMNIAGAYPAESEIKNYVRKISTSEKGITVSDDFNFNGNKKDVVLTLMLKDRCELSDDGTMLKNKTGTIKFSSPCKVKIEEKNIEDSRLRRTWPETICRVLITPEDGSSFTMLFE